MTSNIKNWPWTHGSFDTGCWDRHWIQNISSTRKMVNFETLRVYSLLWYRWSISNLGHKGFYLPTLLDLNFRLFLVRTCFVWRYQYILEVWKFEFQQPVFKKVPLAGLNSLQHKKCQNSTWYSKILTKKNCFQNIKIKLNQGTWMTLQSSVVIFRP